MGSHSSSSTPQVLIEKRFEAGLGQVFFTIGAEVLDISQFSISNLTWNQLEQQLDADRAFARSGDANSDGSNSDAEANDNEEEEENNDEERAQESGDEDESTLEVLDEEAAISSRPSTRAERRARRREARHKKKKNKLAALPRPRKSMDEPLVVRNLYPIVVTIEPTITAENVDKKPVVEAQITHACLYPSSTSAPSSTVPTPSIEVDPIDPNVATSSSAAATSSSSASPDPSSYSSASSSSDANTKYEARVLRQKLLVNGSVYNVYDIFGVEADDPSAIDSDIQASCVICMSEPRTTIVMPCRHMCLCEGCAESLKVQSVKCPICRGPVRGLLKVDVGCEEDEAAREQENGDENDEDAQENGGNINRDARPPVRRERRQVNREDSDEDLESDEDNDTANTQPLRLVDSDADVAQVSDNIRRLRTYADSEEDEDDEDNVHASLVKGAK